MFFINILFALLEWAGDISNLIVFAVTGLSRLPLKKALLSGNLLFNKRCDIIIKLAELKNDAGIIGATLI